MATIHEIGPCYDARFGNVDEIAHPSILFEPKFVQLMERAIETGVILTRQAVEEVFPGVVGWEEQD